MTGMIEKLKRLFQRNREVVLYVFFGGLTTLVNWGTNYLAVQVCANAGVQTAMVPAAIAQVISILFAYVTNRKWVFKSKKSGADEILKEAGSFFGFRALSAVIDVLFMYVTVDRLGWSNSLMKLIANVFIVIVNYIFSKLVVFRKSGSEKGMGNEKAD